MRRQIPRALGTLAALGLLPGACGAPTEEAEPPRATFHTAVSRSAPQVELIDPGRGALRALRLQPSPGDRQAFTVTSSASFSSTIGEAPGPAVQMPATRQSVELVVEDVAEDGGIRCRMRDFGLELQGLQEASQEERSGLERANTATARVLEHARGELKLNPRAFVETAALELPLVGEAAERIPEEQGERLARQLQDSFVGALEGALAALPAEAVGTGARWRVQRDGEREGKITRDEIEYEIVELAEGEVELVFRASTSAPPQTLTLPDGSSGELVDLRGDGRGRLRFDLRRMLPTAGSLTAHSTWEIAGLQNGETTRMTTSETLEVEFAAP